MKKMFQRGGLLVLAFTAVFLCNQAVAQIAHNDEFVQKSGTKLTLGGEDFRYSGPNIEWLGLESYGPHDPIGPRYPSHFEVDDALDTAKAMGARVVRSQTLGDSVNCDLCIEPKEGVFNPAAFKSIDYSIKAAHDRGLRLIVTLAGDCATCQLSGPGQYYPHWDAMLGTGEKTNAQTFSKHAELVNAHGKVYVVQEYGWDVTDWPTRDDFEAVLHAMEIDPRIAGDTFWALQAHTDNFGWQPIPANVTNPVYAKMGESGHWWSLYYGGIKTMVNTAEDMQARAEQLRTHAYKMAGTPVPAHAIPPAPVVTTKGLGFMGWRGSAGAVVYSVQRTTGGKPWETICDKCATDADSPWIIANPGAPFSEHYRVIAYNADGVASEPSAVR
jgi:hypothetical protein